LVTFTGGDFALDGATITSIDGGNITTDSITATQIDSNYVYAGTIDADNINAGTLSADRIVGSGIVRTARGSYTDTITLSESIGASDFSVSITGVQTGNQILVLGYVRMYYGRTCSVYMYSNGHNGDTSMAGGVSAPSGASDSIAFMTSGECLGNQTTASFSIIPGGSGSATVSFDLELVIMEYFK
jgi:hypothetical protein